MALDAAMLASPLHRYGVPAHSGVLDRDFAGDGCDVGLLGGLRETPLEAADLSIWDQLHAWLHARRESVLVAAFPITVWAWLWEWGHASLFMLSVISLIGIGSLWAVASEQLCVALPQHMPSTGVLHIALNNAVLLLVAVAGVHGGTLGVVKYMLMGTVVATSLLWLGLACVRSARGAPHISWNEAGVAPHCKYIAAGVVATYALLGVLDLSSAEVHHTSAGGGSLVMVSRCASLALLGAFVYFAMHVSCRGHEEMLGLQLTSMAVPHAVVEPTTAVGCMALLALMAALLSGFVCVTSSVLAGHGPLPQLPPVFVASVVLPFAAGYTQVVTVARAARAMRADIAVHVCMTSSLTVLLCVLPASVLYAWMEHQPMDLHYSALDLVALAAATACVMRIYETQRAAVAAGAGLAAGYAVFAVVVYYTSKQALAAAAGGGTLPNGDPVSIHIDPIAKR